jgi:GTP cyclohydrolase I
LLQFLEPKPDREGLRETPARVVKAWAHWTSGYDVDTDALLKCFSDGAEKYDEMVFVGSIPFYSHCEHHLAPFFGVAHVGYIPGDCGIVGLSKIPRLVDAFARRLSVQERITTQVADTMERVLKPKGVGVLLQARHMCVESRGVSKPGTITTTSALRGILKEHADARSEFLKLVQLQRGAGLG